MARPHPEMDALLVPGEVAAIFGVDRKTVTRWANAGKIPSIRTPGGHRRFPESQILALRDRGAVKMTRPGGTQ